MLRAISSLHVESQTLEIVSLSRRDLFKHFRTRSLSSQPKNTQTVLTSASPGVEHVAPPPSPRLPPAPPPPPPRPPRLSWHVAATALAVTASLSGFFLYRKKTEDNNIPPDVTVKPVPVAPAKKQELPPAIPSSGDAFPEHVQYLLVGAGTASFAAMRAIRAARPAAQVLMVGDELELPYMRPPLSKELWREPALPPDLDDLTFRQWNGRRRPVLYEPSAFYVSVERLAERPGGGAAVARGWRVARVDPARHEAELQAPGRAPVTVRYDKCLLASGVRARRAPALAAAAAAGRSLTLRGVRDARRLAERLQEAGVRRVAVLGGGLLAAELSAALAARGGATVLQLYREAAPLTSLLPHYLAQEAARHLREAGVTLLPEADVVSSEVVEGGGVRLQLSSGAQVAADLVVECVGAEVDSSLAHASGLETHPALGGLLVTAELQARADVYAAGDVACFYDVALGRRRVEHHDHAVVSGRLAGENMAALAPPKHYTHQSMFWSDLGPHLGYEAIGIIDSSLQTVGVFSAEAVTSTEKRAELAAAVAEDVEAPVAVSVAEVPVVAAAEVVVAGRAAEQRYSRGVVFYVRERRVVGVLLWNLFSRMHVARQVLAQGEFEDLFEVAKLFSLHEDE